MKKIILILIGVVLFLSLPEMSFALQTLDALRKAAAEGDAISQFKLGWSHYEGHYDANAYYHKPVKEDYALALSWITKSAEQGYVIAQSVLGAMYYSGKAIVKQDYVKAFEMCSKAAAQGNTNAEYLLGVMYENGQVVGVDIAKAIEWYRRASIAKRESFSFSNLSSQQAKSALKRLGVDDDPDPKVVTASVKQPASAKQQIPQLKELENVLEFLKLPAPELKKGEDFVIYNLCLLVSYAKPREALAYAQSKAGVFKYPLINSPEGFYQYLRAIINFDTEFRRRLNNVLRARDAGDYQGLVSSLQSLVSMSVSTGLEPYNTHQIDLSLYVEVYDNMINDLKKSLNTALNYRQVNVVKQPAISETKKSPVTVKRSSATKASVTKKRAKATKTTPTPPTKPTITKFKKKGYEGRE